ncbi:hypothetical protein JK628_07295 [Shewanella sp. KX20019]|nr:hypothetical protein JK628_07295 [Shewanella sp. KX20019]
MGNDQLSGGSGNDLLFAGDGDDKLDGGSGNDELYGGSGDDNLAGGSGDDILFGDSGSDTLDGGSGADQMFGGAGDDTIVFDRGDFASNADGSMNSDSFSYDGGDGFDVLQISSVNDEIIDMAGAGIQNMEAFIVDDGVSDIQLLLSLDKIYQQSDGDGIVGNDNHDPFENNFLVVGSENIDLTGDGNWTQSDSTLSSQDMDAELREKYEAEGVDIDELQGYIFSSDEGDVVIWSDTDIGGISLNDEALG